jgi:hypothetical protein
MLWINLLGGAAVLGSYAHGLLTHPQSGQALWGGVPAAAQPLYGVGMLAAALGYFAFTYFLFFRLDPEQSRIGGRFGFGLFNLLYLAILLPSAMWMPLTFVMVERPSLGLWWGIRLVLAVVGLAALGLVGALLSTKPKRPGWAYWLAVVGSVAFCLHTGVLDALVWPAFFPI